ncbi:organic cation/carnitine transporter 4-like [Bidens hawaiensis]|uniref:organic cation/carnitine transporter 4-like n=1 Tax=Bidens hawaiensis TaxID=980011 RepID=UPI004048EF25
MSSHKRSLDDLRPPLLPRVETIPTAKPSFEMLTVDQMLTKYCGEFGFWQVKHFFLTCMAWALEAFPTMVMIFADRELDWTCNPGSGCVWDTDKSVCGLEPGSWRWVDGSEGWSKVAEWGLVCGEKYKVGLVQALFFAGCMIGGGIFGHFSDSKLGRKGSLTIVCIMNVIFGLMTSLSPNYWTYVLLRLLTGFSTGGVGVCAFVLATEPIGPTKRGIAGMSLGIALLSGMAYIVRSWRLLYIASSIPSIIFLVFMLPFISESPRWYLIRGQTDQAMKIMHEIAKSNGKHLPENVHIVLDNETESWGHKGIEAGMDENVKGSVMDVIKSPLLRKRLLLLMGINYTAAVVYYGLNLNATNLKTNLYLSVLLNSIAEMPAYLLTAILIDRFGSKPLGIGTQWFSGIFCIMGSLMGSQENWKVMRMVCGILGIFGVAGTYNLLFVYAMELFPTVVRNAALGCAKQVGQLGNILVPFVVAKNGDLSFMVFGACGIVVGFLMFYLPETLNKPLYDTISGVADEESERLTETILY